MSFTVREKPPTRISHGIETPSGRHFRWGGDEPDPANIPSGVSFSDVMPGGFENASGVLPRKPGIEYNDLERLSTWTIYGAGGEIVWQGRLERAPRTSGSQMAVSPAAVGYQAALDDNKSASMVYIDTDLSKWRGPSNTRRVALDTANFTVSDPATESDLAGNPSLRFGIDGTWAAPREPMVEGWYDAGPGGVGLLAFTPGYSTQVGLADPNWALVGLAADADDGTGTTDTTGNQFPTVAQVALTTTGIRRFAVIQWFYQATPSGIDGYEFTAWLRSVAVIGAHGLTVRINPALGAGGFWASDIVAHAVRTWAPDLTFTEGSNGTVKPSSFVISQAAFPDPTTVAEIVRQVSRFELPYWAVWDHKTFHWDASRTPRKRWRARISPTQLEETGPQIDRVWESIIVQYQDVDGSTRTVGPPGSGADTETSDLLDIDPENPANKLGIIRRDMLTIGTATVGAATQVGKLFLAQAKLLDSSGRAQIVGHVQDDHGVLFPYHAVRSGDEISFVDAADSSYRRIVHSDKEHASRTCSIDLDAPPEGLTALLERFAANLVRLGVS